MIDYKQQYGLNVPGRSEMGNIDLNARVPYYPEGLGGVVKTEESTTIPINPDGTPFKGKADVATHKEWVNIPTVLHGTQRNGPDDLLQRDAVMNYMLTGKHLGKYDQGMNKAVDGAINIHLRQDAYGKQGLLPPEVQMELIGEIEKAARESRNAPPKSRN
jgi:hypothetical protein